MGLFCENILVCTNYEGQEIQTAFADNRISKSSVYLEAF